MYTRSMRFVLPLLVLAAPAAFAQAPAPSVAQPAKPVTAPAAPAAPKPGPAAAAPKPAGTSPAPAPAGSPAKPAATTGAAPVAATSPASSSAPAAAPARAPVAELVALMQKTYEGTGSIKARFSQTLAGPMGKRQASGAVILKKPGKMRWDYEKPEKKLFVADGTLLWVYEPEDEQAFKQSLSSSQLPTQVSFLFGRGRLMDDFVINYLDGQPFGVAGDAVLKLVPKVATAQYKHLVFVVNPKTGLVKETVLYDQQDGTNHIVFSEVTLNPKAGVEDTRFAFTPPPGTKIINPTR